MEEAVAMVHSPTQIRDVLAAWDFDVNITAKGIREFSKIHDVTTSRLHGELVNMPMRAVTGACTGRRASGSAATSTRSTTATTR